MEWVVSSIWVYSQDLTIIVNKDSSLPQLTNYPGLKIEHDIYPGKGSLGGVYTGLIHSESQYNFVVGCDMPFLNLDLIRYMTGLTDFFDAIVPKTINNVLEPLHAIYSKNCISKIEFLINQNKLSILDLFPLIQVRYVEYSEIVRFDNASLSFFNINTESDLELGKQLISKKDFKFD